MAAAGYDDDRRLSAGRGAILVRSSWGTRWGDGGYGWLPYGYVSQQLAADFWTFVSPNWLAYGEFSDYLSVDPVIYLLDIRAAGDVHHKRELFFQRQRRQGLEYLAAEFVGAAVGVEV